MDPVETTHPQRRITLGVVADRSELTLQRTGNIFSIAATEYRVTYPDGHEGTVWSPPWNEWDDPEEDARASTYAAGQWLKRTHKE